MDLEESRPAMRFRSIIIESGDSILGLACGIGHLL